MDDTGHRIDQCLLQLFSILLIRLYDLEKRNESLEDCLHQVLNVVYSYSGLPQVDEHVADADQHGKTKFLRYVILNYR